MLFNITGDVAPPPDLTSPNIDIEGAMYVWQKMKIQKQKLLVIINIQ